MIDFWVKFWSIFLFFSLGIFFILAVTVTIGGFCNILSLFSILNKEHEKLQDTTEEVKY